MTDLQELRQGRTIIRPGDTGRGRYLVQRIVQVNDDPSSVEVHAYGGRPGHLQGRVFAHDRVIRCRSPRDPNSALRDALHEVSEASKKRKGGR